MEIELISNGCQSCELKMLNLSLIMYADDTVLFSDNITELQNMIDCIDSYSNEYGLTINLSKTKVVGYRNRGVVKDDEKLFLNVEC